MVWLWIYGPQNGVLNSILNVLGIPSVDWLGNPATAKPAIVIMRIWQASGYYMLMFLTGLQTIPDVLYEVAEIDGASKWEKLRYITIPLLSPTTFLWKEMKDADAKVWGLMTLVFFLYLAGLVMLALAPFSLLV